MYDDLLDDDGPSKLKKMSSDKYEVYRVRKVVDQAFDEAFAAHELGEILDVDPKEHFLKDYKGPETIYFRTGESSAQIYYDGQYGERPGTGWRTLRDKIENSEFPAHYKQEWDKLRENRNRIKKWFGSC